MAISKNWSASRLSTHTSCLLKYYYTYIKKWVPNIEPPKEEANKGLCFHETVEQYNTGMDKNALLEILKSKITQYSVDTTKYDEASALSRFFLFWDEFVTKNEQIGYNVKKESWSKGLINGESFVGALDLFLDNPDIGKCIIFDYKSAKTPVASTYKNQLLLYAYLIGMEKGWDYKQIAENVKLYVFFPFSKQEKPISDFEKMLASIKQIKFDASDVENVIKLDSDIITSIKSTDWDSIDLDTLGNFQFGCKWCPFMGTIPNADGFKGCKVTYDKGYHQNRNLIFKMDE